MRNILKSKTFKNIVVGVLVASTAYLYMEQRFEQKLLNAHLANIYNSSEIDFRSNESTVLGVMAITHKLMKNDKPESRLQLNTVEHYTTSPLLNYAFTKEGACGGNSLVLAETLQGMGYDVRVAQMKVNGKYGGHIVTEAKVDDKWVALDAFYNLSFRKMNGGLASISDVQNHWNHYLHQTPIEYDSKYAYTDFRYTNWDRLPVLGSVAKGIMTIVMGKDATKTFSIRTYLLQPKHTLFVIVAFITTIVLLIMLLRRVVIFVANSKKQNYINAKPSMSNFV